ncbi:MULTISPECIES: hypothetical protein [Streptomyces]|nr:MULTISPECIES: hypothetical protein [Streptomyces]
MYSIEMAYARMRELQDMANRSRANVAAPRKAAKKARGAKKR